MKFYEIDGAFHEAIEKGERALRIKIAFYNAGVFLFEASDQIIQADFYAHKEEGGGVSSRGEVLIDNTSGAFSTNAATQGAGIKAFVYFAFGDNFFHRWTLYVNDKGFQDIHGEGRKRSVYIVLRDGSEALRKTDNQRDWKEAAAFTYIKVCDKSEPEKSLLHLIAKRAGLGAGDIDCATIPLTLPFVRLTKNIWSELSELASAYRCHLESAVEKPLVFAYSPYQSEKLEEDGVSRTFSGADIFYLRVTALSGYYRNSVRLKINLPVSLERQEIWRYTDAPVFYTQALRPYYPFREHTLREIEREGYEARYRVIAEGGKARPVVYADMIDCKEEAEARISAQGGVIKYSRYDTASHKEKALLTLNADGESDLFSASIHGRPIVLDLNTTHYETDGAAAALFGTAALNVTGGYFSSDLINGEPHYADWVKRELSARLARKKEYTIKTNKAFVNARVGAKIKLVTKEHNVTGRIHSLKMRYKKEAAFVEILKFSNEAEL